jgi:hypothetical protein
LHAAKYAVCISLAHSLAMAVSKANEAAESITAREMSHVRRTVLEEAPRITPLSSPDGGHHKVFALRRYGFMHQKTLLYCLYMR